MLVMLARFRPGPDAEYAHHPHFTPAPPSTHHDAVSVEATELGGVFLKAAIR